nr:zinc-binding dehydrogenase [Saprospiraceae bacterium]
MKAIVFENLEKGFCFREDVKRQSARPDEIEVQVSSAALNKRDDFVIKGLYPGLVEKVIMGSDASGIWKGRAVLINPGINWGDSQEVQSRDYQILGMPSHGTFAEWVKVPQQNVYPAPDHLDKHEAAALPLAGLTAYRALFSRGKLQSGQKVLISGGGGGVAMTCIQMALAVGAEVYATTGSLEKQEKLIDLGVKSAVDYGKEDWDKTLQKSFGNFDLVIDSAGGDGLKKLIGLVKPAGNLVLYGGTKGKSDGISPQIIFWRQLNIMGTSMGSDRDFREMLELVTKHKIRPVIDSVFPLDDFQSALDRLRSPHHFGKVVLQVAE